MRTSAAEARIAETLLCTAWSRPECSEGGSARSASLKRAENQPYVMEMGVLEARLEHCCSEASSSPGMSSPPSTSCASRPAWLLGMTECTWSAWASQRRRSISSSFSCSLMYAESSTHVSTVLPLTVPHSSRIFHQRPKIVALKKERMKVTKEVHRPKKASQSWKM